METDPVAAWRTAAKALDDVTITEVLADCDWLLQLADAGELEYAEDSRQLIEWRRAGYRQEQAWRRHGRGSRDPARGLRREPTDFGYPRGFLEEIKRRIDLIDLIHRDGTELRPAGGTWSGDCPFHASQSRRSFHVFGQAGDPDQHFHCFGCGMHGDCFSWEQARWGHAFGDAVAYSAALAGLDWPQETDRGERTQPGNRNERARSQAAQFEYREGKIVHVDRSKRGSQ